MGPKPLVFVWDPNSMEVVQRWKSPLKKGISSLAFSPNAKMLACAAIDDDHYVAVLNVS